MSLSYLVQREPLFRSVHSTHCDGSQNQTNRSSVPDQAIFCCTPEGVWPHGSRGNSLHSVGVISKHVHGLLDSQVMDVHLGICSSRDEDPIPRVRQELWERDWTLRLEKHWGCSHGHPGSHGAAILLFPITQVSVHAQESPATAGHMRVSSSHIPICCNHFLPIHRENKPGICIN